MMPGESSSCTCARRNNRGACVGWPAWRESGARERVRGRREGEAPRDARAVLRLDLALPHEAVDQGGLAHVRVAEHRGANRAWRDAAPLPPLVDVLALLDDGALERRHALAKARVGHEDVRARPFRHGVRPVEYKDLLPRADPLREHRVRGGARDTGVAQLDDYVAHGEHLRHEPLRLGNVPGVPADHRPAHAHVRLGGGGRRAERPGAPRSRRARGQGAPPDRLEADHGAREQKH
eukprot:scaffold38601_cov45-Phaeocystis_antarctica.AAC.3